MLVLPRERVSVLEANSTEEVIDVILDWLHLPQLLHQERRAA
jgi:putative heme iron utilization protein